MLLFELCFVYLENSARFCLFLVYVSLRICVSVIYTYIDTYNVGFYALRVVLV